MTGKDLIKYIKKHNLEGIDIIGSDEDGIKFKTDMEGMDYAFLWLHDDWVQDIIWDHEGDLTYGVENDFNEEIIFAAPSSPQYIDPVFDAIMNREI